MSKPTVFIGSSSEGLDVARALQIDLDDEAEASILSDHVFALGEYSFETLLRVLERVDFAILVLTPNDLVSQRGGSATSPRENVIFELGLFMGRLGRSRTFIVMDDEGSPIPLPSDLAGITVSRFRRPVSGNLLAALGPASLHIREHIRTAVREERSARSQAAIEQYSCFISYSAQDRVFAERIHNDLQEVGIRCWLDSKDLKIGDHIEVQINRAIQLTDKVLLILSEASVNSAWVRREIDVALKKESQGNKTILFPIRIDDAVMKAADESSTTLVRLKHIGDFTEWTVPDGYRRAFSRLVKDLTVSAAAEQDRKL
jgi:Predicted nucleotide-binding protein containing TIR-like domain/TIR domain